MFRNKIFTILLFGSLCASVTAASAEVVFKENFSGYYADGISKNWVDPDNVALNVGDIRFGSMFSVKLVELSTIATYDTTGGLQSVPITTNPAITASDIPAGRGGNIVNGALYFPYAAGINSWKEQRFHMQDFALGNRPGLTDFWVQYDIFIPTNFEDRGVAGSWGSKVFTLYSEDYGHQPHFILGRGNTGLDSVQSGNFSYIDGEDGKLHYAGMGDPGQLMIERSIDAGKWQRHTIHIKLPTNYTSNDGEVGFWVRHGNGVVKKHAEILNGDFLDKFYPYLKDGYLLGWSNNGFDKPTSFLITNFILAESVQHIDKDSIVYVAAPKSPATLLAVKK